MNRLTRFIAIASAVTPIPFLGGCGHPSPDTYPPNPKHSPIAVSPDMHPIPKQIVVGSFAPPLAVGEWLRGDPIKSYDLGKVYVVTLFSTISPDRDQAWALLAGLAKKFSGQTHFVAVSTWENPNGNLSDQTIKKRVEAYLKAASPNMEYFVGRDSHDEQIAKMWMKASGETQLPRTFVINGEGKVAWFGNPRDGLDKMIDKVVHSLATVHSDKSKSTHVLPAKAPEKKSNPNRKADLDLAIQQADESARIQDHAAAIAQAEAILTKYPEAREEVSLFKFDELLASNVPTAMKFARELASGNFGSSPVVLNSLAFRIGLVELNPPGLDLKLAEALAKRAIKLNDAKKIPLPYLQDTLALVFYRQGKRAEAVKLENTALVAAGHLPGDQGSPEALRQMQDHLKRFLASK